ncbi:fimbria/pilus periplasmic chaperone, partial [Klebsiella pneumoniae]|nr:fimbria/pilus periplasmic chaperone [Klebsiella pneumoniae]MDZ0087286.1 fimbria/pilus periplasmic chaperone [Klebsiella pneumoniae]MDZ0179597.1 fimbria/pilus periplasmic chaperone [Klebsiella pneumoniae]
MMKKIIAVAAFLLCTTAAQAGIVMGGTRVIYQEGKREAAISVTNADTHTPYLVQSWVENYAENDKARVPFIVEGANKQVISSQADSLIKISRIWADFFPANT